MAHSKTVQIEEVRLAGRIPRPRAAKAPRRQCHLRTSGCRIISCPISS